ncbi:hypothetical protein [Microbacterium sp. BK668]|uniref:hypothetical protein n=1 Tax=Microbacterium sp. BK668 TaxID=2512118 RepID=UPI00105B2407|nr:hypothetical protein [Microbacterium sp. BK668]TDN87757.1 hypothetical protein EV279_3190 [Microbacterium sp. BK668]
MHAIDLIIGEYVHRLPKDADENAVLTELKEAVHAGGGIVDLPTYRPTSSVAVLISPGVPVFVERTLIEDEAVPEVFAAPRDDVIEWSDC